MTGYGINRVGESQISAWELGSKSCRKPLISVMNLFALSTGFILKPSKVIEAYYRGCRSKNLYYLSETMQETEIDALNFESIKRNHLDIKTTIKHKWLRQLEFIGYIIISLFIHLFMLVAGKALLTAEWMKKKITQNE